MRCKRKIALEGEGKLARRFTKKKEPKLTGDRRFARGPLRLKSITCGKGGCLGTTKRKGGQMEGSAPLRERMRR